MNFCRAYKETEQKSKIQQKEAVVLGHIFSVRLFLYDRGHRFNFFFI